MMGTNITKSITQLGEQEGRLLASLASQAGDIFTFEQAVDFLSGDRAKARKILSRLEKKNWLRRIERGKYLIIPLEAGLERHWSQDSFIIASYLVDPYIISYWSALNHWGLTEQIPRTVFVQTTVRRSSREKEILGSRFLFITVVERKFFGAKDEWFDSHRVRIAEREKALADCLDRPDLCGGIIEAAKGLWYGHKDRDVDFDRLTDYAQRMGNMAIVKRLGFLSELMGFDLGLLYDRWRSMLTQGFSLLDPTLPREGRYRRRWRLIVNLDERMLLSWRQS